MGCNNFLHGRATGKELWKTPRVRITRAAASLDHSLNAEDRTTGESVEPQAQRITRVVQMFCLFLAHIQDIVIVRMILSTSLSIQLTDGKKR